MNLRNRRSFLKTAAGASAAGLMAGLGDIQRSVSVDIEASKIGRGRGFQELANEYSLAKDVNYLNHASIGCIPIPVQKARVRFLEVCESNPWFHMWGKAWKEPLKDVRNKIANLIGCNDQDVAITHNTTEMFNTLANGLRLKKNDEVLFSTLCHSGACLPFQIRSKWGSYQTRKFDFPIDRAIDMTVSQLVDTYVEQIKPETRVLVIPHMDNTVGLRYPVAELASAARDKGVEFIAVDAAQTVGMISIDCQSMDVDMLATSAHKWMGGPKGTGVAYVNQRTQDHLRPMWMTWGHKQWSETARKFEDYGTRNLPEAMTLGPAIDFLTQWSDLEREGRLKEIWELTQHVVDSTEGLTWASSRKWELGGSIYSIQVDRPAKKLADELFEQHQIVVRPFTKFGLNNVRISPNTYTTEEQIKQAIELMAG